MGGTAAQLALLVVVVNLVACLIASRSMTVAEQTEAIAGLPPASRPSLDRPAPPPGGWLSIFTNPQRTTP